MSEAAVINDAADAEHAEALGFWRKYVFSTDHKRIGKQYLEISLFMALAGSFAVYAIRWQFAWPGGAVPGLGALTPHAYNSLVTMHGSIMVFWVAMPMLLGAGFYDPAKGGDPLLWEHLFWFFGHPGVYVVALPGFGIMLEIMPVFARKPIFGYRTIIYSTIIAVGLSLVVWAHHMFVSGMDPRLATPFSVTTILISVPFAIIVFAMIATLWGGSLIFDTPMLFVIGGLASFIVGGVTGIFLGSAASDIYLHGAYFVVAHFHYTLFPVTFFGGFAGLYYWYPKMFGRMMDERFGKIHFWLTFVFFQATFIPLFTVSERFRRRRARKSLCRKAGRHRSGRRGLGGMRCGAGDRAATRATGFIVATTPDAHRTFGIGNDDRDRE